jgi:hypothetical protein
LLIYCSLTIFVPFESKQKHYLLLAKSKFENFNNETGEENLIVPNIVHFLRFEQPEVRFADAVCILAAVKNHKPDQLFLHTNVGNFTGKYWDYLLNTPEFRNIYQIKSISLPPTIFGQKFSEGWHKSHASDVTRIRILMQYGGIFLDNDSYVVKRLNKYLKFEMTLAWDVNKFMGTQVLIAHPDARFLKLWLESYRNSYDSTKWYYNAGERPTTTVLNNKPELVHRVRLKLGVQMLAKHLYRTFWKKWSDQEAIHLVINHRHYLDKENYKIYPEFNDVNIMNCNVTFCFMARKAYFY